MANRIKVLPLQKKHMKKQTAVELLEKKLKTYLSWSTFLEEDFKEAKQMEKEQHQETFKQSRQAKIFEEGMPPVWESFEQYYNETYGLRNTC